MRRERVDGWRGREKDEEGRRWIMGREGRRGRIDMHLATYTGTGCSAHSIMFGYNTILPN
jgi:hypothetical protein